MNKPLKDWTLGEIKQECKKHPGACCIKRDCPFMGDAGCALKRATGDVPPYMWDLSGPPGWTKQDKEDAKRIRRLLPWAENIRRTNTGNLLINSCVYEIYPGLIIYDGFFPSLKPGESVTLDEIIGGAE